MDQQKLFNINHAKAIETIKALAGITAFILFIGYCVR